MSAELRYKLADSTVIEPLVNQWSAWPQLLSPVPASLHLANYQLPALASYLKDPLSHVAASRDPEMIGGPFVDLPPERAAEIEIGFVMAFVASLLVVRPFLEFIRRAGFAPFAWYRIVLGLAIVAALAAGWR
jgi:hypothetical protein